MFIPMIRLSAVILVALAGAAAAADLRNPALPDPVLTPGATNPDISQGNISETICNHGKWSTRSIRPPVAYTSRLKRQQIRQYGYADRDPRHYEEDHVIALTIGGHPTDPHNLWPQPYAGRCNARHKDRLENTLHRLVCAGELTLADAQAEIATDWTESYRAHVDPAGC
jgi:hypothetical protein